MPKTVFIAALAIVAMASCTKNEISQSTRTNEIKFTTPVLARHTKSQEITTTTYPTTASFNVYAWYNSEAAFTASTASAYMENVKVDYDATDFDASNGSGAWVPSLKYYWPKQGVLSFDAYSPNGLSGTVTATALDGIKVVGHEVSTTLDNQQDFLYAKRALNKQSSYSDGNDTYDGVDIAFNHALAVVKFTAKTNANYSGTTFVKIKDIKIQAINNQGTFEQKESTTSPGWSAQTGSKEYVALTAANFDASLNLSTTPVDAGSTVIVLPQDFVASTQKLYIEYYLKTDATGAKPILQKAELDFYNSTALADGNKWEMGKRYTYNIVIGLDEIYFAPSVENWVDITVDGINVE